MERYEYEEKVFFRPATGKLIKVTQNFAVPEGEDEEEKIITVENVYTSFSVSKEEESQYVIEEIKDPSIPEMSDDVLRLRDLGVELGEIKKWFADTDYIPNKVFVGEWPETDERWISYKAERTKKRARQDEIMKQLTNPSNLALGAQEAE